MIKTNINCKFEKYQIKFQSAGVCLLENMQNNIAMPLAKVMNYSTSRGNVHALYHYEINLERRPCG